MKIALVSVDIFVRSVRGDAQYQTRFGPGINVISAPNSWGKSTLLQSVVYALGLEGALSASRRSPLGPAMTQLIDTRDGRSPVIESSVTLTVSNEAGAYLRIRRWGKSADFKLNLVQVWTAGSEQDLDSAARQDLFVRDPGSTFSHVGFHRVLEEFIGWKLPAVPNHNNGETKLYLAGVSTLRDRQALLPLRRNCFSCSRRITQNAWPSDRVQFRFDAIRSPRRHRSGPPCG